MPMVYCGACSHAPGITARPERADTQTKQALYTALTKMGDDIRATRPDALVVVAAEHFANFFMNNMPAYCVGMGDHYEGPIEDEKWLAIARHRVPGNAALSRRLVQQLLHTIDVAYAEEWKFDHGIMVPLHFLTPRYDLPVIPVNINCQGPPLTPLPRAYEFGRALRRACDALPERIALVGANVALFAWAQLAPPEAGFDPQPLGRQIELAGAIVDNDEVVAQPMHLEKRDWGRKGAAHTARYMAVRPGQRNERIRTRPASGPLISRTSSAFSLLV